MSNESIPVDEFMDRLRKAPDWNIVRDVHAGTVILVVHDGAQSEVYCAPEQTEISSIEYSAFLKELEEFVHAAQEQFDRDTSDVS